MATKRTRFMDMPASTGGGDGDTSAIPFINSKMFAPETLLIMISNSDPSSEEDEELERYLKGEKIDPTERKRYVPAIYGFYQYDYSNEGYQPGKAPTLHAFEIGDQTAHPNFDVTVTDSSGIPMGLKSRSLAYIFNLTAYRALVDNIDGNTQYGSTKEEDGEEYYDENRLYPDVLEESDLFYQTSTEPKVDQLRKNEQFSGLMLYEFGPHVIKRLQDKVIQFSAKAERRGVDFRFDSLVLSFTQTYDKDGKPEYGKPDIAVQGATRSLPRHVRDHLKDITAGGLPPLYPIVQKKKYGPEEDTTPQQTLSPPRQARVATTNGSVKQPPLKQPPPTDAEVDDMPFEDDR